MKDEPKQKDGQRIMPLIEGVVTVVMIAFGLICYFKSMHTIQEISQRHIDSYQGIIEDLHDELKKRRQCYCQPEDEPWN